jgi:hypothetical protein
VPLAARFHQDSVEQTEWVEERLAMRTQRLVRLNLFFRFKNLTSLDTANTVRAALKYPLRTIEQNDGLVGVER